MGDEAEEVADEEQDYGDENERTMSPMTRKAQKAAEEKAAREEEKRARLQRARSNKGRMKPGQRWNGRLSGLNLQEYRELKWGTEAGWGQVCPRSSKYSVRGKLPGFKSASTNCLLPIEPHLAFDATRPKGPSATIGNMHMITNDQRSPGPAQYDIKSTMDPRKHPTLAKTCGATFGRERLRAVDEPSPAPGDYSVDNFERSSAIVTKPKWPIQGREAWREPTAAPGPGVGEYKFENTTRVGKITTNKFTIQSKCEPPLIPLGERRVPKPGPDHYKPPGHIDCKNNHCASNKPPIWSLSREPRGL